MTSILTQSEVVAVDGKTARGSRDRRRGTHALHMDSAWGGRKRLDLGQADTAAKSNEITAIPKLLERLELTVCILTFDAMGCQTKTAAQLVEQGGDSVLGLKGHQSPLHHGVAALFTTAHESLRNAWCILTKTTATSNLSLSDTRTIGCADHNKQVFREHQGEIWRSISTVYPSPMASSCRLA